jgi:hypothetical protein
VAETGTLSEEVPKATADQALALTAVAALPAWDLEAEVEAVEEAAEVGAAGRRHRLRKCKLQGARNEINIIE